MVAVEYYNQHYDPFIHHRHGNVDLNFNIMNHITFIVLLLNFFIKTFSLNILIVCHILNKVLYIMLICLCSLMLCTLPCTSNNYGISCLDVKALLTPDGAIPARRYTFSTDDGLRHPVMERHASFRAGSSLLTCFDLFHTGHAYFAVE